MVPAGGGAKFHRSKSSVLLLSFELASLPAPLVLARLLLAPNELPAFEEVIVEFTLNSPFATLAIGMILVGVSDFFRLDLDSVFSGVAGGATCLSGVGEMILGC